MISEFAQPFVPTVGLFESRQLTACDGMRNRLEKSSSWVLNRKRID